MLLKENDVAKANNTVRSEEISSEIWFIALSYPSLSSLLGRAVRRGIHSLGSSNCAFARKLPS